MRRYKRALLLLWCLAACDPSIAPDPGAGVGPDDADVTDVREHGAVGDGVTDDTAALQRAVHASRRVLLPAGRFLVSRLVLDPDTTLVGDPGAILIGKANADGPVVVLAARSRIETV